MREKSERLSISGELQFMSGIEEIGGLLNRVDPATSTLLQAVDAKGQDYSTYYFAGFAEFRDVESAINVYRSVKNLVRIIVLMDRYFEVGNERYRRLGKALIAKLRTENQGYMKNVLEFNLKQFWPFWKFEQYTKELLMSGHAFSQSEIRCFNLFKSSDAGIIYGGFLESTLPHFNRNASLLLHYNQALQDIEDDFDDIQEDLRDQMPNIFILSSVGEAAMSYSRLYKHRANGAKMSIVEKSSERVLEIVEDYESSIEGLVVPDQFQFLKYLSRYYAGRIRKKLGVVTDVRNSLKTAQT